MLLQMALFRSFYHGVILHRVYVCVYHIFFIHSSLDGYLGCFHVLAIVNIAAVNIGLHMSFRVVVFSGYMPSSVIAGLYGSFFPSF